MTSNLGVFLISTIFLLWFKTGVLLSSVENISPKTSKVSPNNHVKFLDGRRTVSECLLHPNHIAFVLSIFTLSPEHSANRSKVFKQWYSEFSVPSSKKKVSSAYWLSINSLSCILTVFMLLSDLILSARSSTHGRGFCPSVSPLGTALYVLLNVLPYSWDPSPLPPPFISNGRQMFTIRFSNCP